MSETKTNTPTVTPSGTSQSSALMDFGGNLFQGFVCSAAEQVEAYGSLSDEQNAEFATYMQTNNPKILAKRDRLGEFLARLDSEAEAIRAEEKRLAARRARFEKISSCMRYAIYQQMLNSGIKRIEGKLFSFCIRKNPDHVDVTNPDDIPPEFITYEPRIDRQRIKDALENGKQVPGAELVRSTRLDVR
jgi:hypothetical protein